MIPVNDIGSEAFDAGRENAERPIVLCHGWPEHAVASRRHMTAPVMVGDFERRAGESAAVILEPREPTQRKDLP